MITDYLVTDTEKIFLHKIFWACEQIHWDKQISADEKQKIKSKLLDCIDNKLTFSLPIYQQIYNIYTENIKRKIFLKYTDILFQLSSLSIYKNRQGEIKKVLEDITDSGAINLSPLYYYSLEQLKNEILAINRKNEIKKAAEQIISSSNDSAFSKGIQQIAELTQTPIPEKQKSELERIKEEILNNIHKTDDLTSRAILKRDLRTSYNLADRDTEALINQLSVPPVPVPVVKKVVTFLQENLGGCDSIYPGLLPAFALTMISGLSGSGKSLLAYDLLFSYLNNEEFLGEKPSILAKNPKKRGLIINSDQPDMQAQAMLSQNIKVHRSGDSCDYVNNWTLADLAWLELLIKEVGYTFIVIDSFIGINSHLPAFDDCSPTAHLGLVRLQAIAQKYKCTIVIIHHANKDVLAKGVNKAKGSAYIVSTVSALWTIEQSPDHELKKEFQVMKIRNAPRQKLFLEFDPNTYTHQVIAGIDKNAADTAANVLSIFKQKQVRVSDAVELSVDDLMKSFTGSDKNTIKGRLYKALTKLEQRGEIQKRVDPTDYKRRLYSLKSAQVSETTASSTQELSPTDAIALPVLPSPIPPLNEPIEPVPQPENQDVLDLYDIQEILGEINPEAETYDSDSDYTEDEFGLEELD